MFSDVAGEDEGFRPDVKDERVLIREVGAAPAGEQQQHPAFARLPVIAAAFLAPLCSPPLAR